MGSVDDASNAEILQRWMDLIRKSDEIGQRFIANADWRSMQQRYPLPQKLVVEPRSSL